MPSDEEILRRLSECPNSIVDRGGEQFVGMPGEPDFDDFEWSWERDFPVATLFAKVSLYRGGRAFPDRHEAIDWYGAERDGAYNPSYYDELERSVALNGVTDELSVAELEDGRLDLLDGWHRLALAIKHRLKTVPVFFGRLRRRNAPLHWSFAPRRRNSDEELRFAERHAAASPDDPGAAARLLVLRARRGDNAVARWYGSNLYGLDVDERDFRALIEFLVRGWGRNGPRDWAWLSVMPPEETGPFRYVLAVRESHHARPDNRLVVSDEITVGFTVFRPEPDPRGMRLHGRWGVHPRHAWPELASQHELASMPSGGYRVDIPVRCYTAFEAVVWDPVEAKKFSWKTDVIPSGRQDVVMAHGCEIRGPDPVHADMPRGLMFRWGARRAPDRAIFSVMEARAYVGLDPLTGN